MANKMMDAYTKHLLLEGEAPKSVYQFTEKHKWKEKDFYDNYASFKDVESKVFLAFYEQALKMLNADKSFISFDAQNKLLGFYFTYFEILTANRSLVFLLLNEGKFSMQNFEMLQPFKNQFKEMISTLEIKGIDVKNDMLDKFQNTGISEGSWGQFLMTLKFWMNDTSKNFEKTDLFIEKSIRASFELMQTRPLQSVVDFGKFLFKETLQKS
jgi:hypothetical protein